MIGEGPSDVVHRLRSLSLSVSVFSPLTSVSPAAYRLAATARRHKERGTQAQAAQGTHTGTTGPPHTAAGQAKGQASPSVFAAKKKEGRKQKTEM